MEALFLTIHRLYIDPCYLRMLAMNGRFVFKKKNEALQIVMLLNGGSVPEEIEKLYRYLY